MKKKWLSLSLVTVVLAAGCSGKPPANPPANSPGPSTPPTPTQTSGEVVFLQKQDLDGDGKVETVSLLGFDKKDPNQTMSFKRITIRVEREGTTQDIQLEGESANKPLDLSVVDLNSDGKKEIAYKSDPGEQGGKGQTRLTLYTPDAEMKYKEMTFEGRDPEFKLRLLNSNKYELLDPQLNKDWTLQLNEERTAQTGNPNMSGKKPQVDPAHEWNWTDIDNDGKIDLISKRAVWMAVHTNILFDVQTVYKWDGKAWKPQGYTILPADGVKLVR